MWTEYVVNNIRSIRLQLNKNYIDMQCVDICSLQLPTNPTPLEHCMVCDASTIQLPIDPTPTELCMVTPKYNTVHVYKIRQPTTILQFKMLCIIQSPIDPTPTEYELS